jgi:hypothetical protein
MPLIKDFHPVFYNEDPDPLPDLDMSGNPISLHFSPNIKDEIKVTQFKLKNNNTNKFFTERNLNSKNDPNKLFHKGKKNKHPFFSTLDFSLIEYFP